MRIVREIGNLSWEKVTKFRRAVSKSKGYDALREFEDEFRVGAASHGWTQDQIDHIWNELVTFGTRNKSTIKSFNIDLIKQKL